MSDFQVLLAPISDEKPAGADLRSDSADLTFQRVEELRREIEPELDPEGSGRAADWRGVIRECEDALTKRSKDLQVAAFLCEAWTRLDGLAGLESGLRLVHGLLEGFWSSVHPGVEDDGEIYGPLRAKPLGWLGGSADFLRSVSEARWVEVGGRTLSWRSYVDSQLVDEKRALSDQSQFKELVEAGYVTGEDWRAALGSVPVDNLRELAAHVASCEAVLGELRNVCESRFDGEDAPSWVKLAELLLDMREYLTPLVRDVPAGEVAVGGEAAVGAAGPAAAGAPSGPLASRADALRALQTVAEYFRRTEPHSPVSYLVERAVRWGKMPLEDVLREVVQDESVLARVWDTLGLAPGSGGE